MRGNVNILLRVVLLAFQLDFVWNTLILLAKQRTFSTTSRLNLCSNNNSKTHSSEEFPMWKNESWLLQKFNISSGTSSSDVTYRWWRCERRRTRSRWTSAACTSSRRPSRPAGAAWTAHRTLWPWQQQAVTAPSSNFHLMPSTCAAFKAPSDISLTSGVAATQQSGTHVY